MDREDNDKEDAEEEEDDVDGGEVFLALAKGEMALSAFGKELSRHQGGPEIQAECTGQLSDQIWNPRCDEKTVTIAKVVMMMVMMMMRMVMMMMKMMMMMMMT